MAGYWPFSAPDAGWSEIDNVVQVEFISVVETYFLGSCTRAAINLKIKSFRLSLIFAQMKLIRIFQNWLVKKINQTLNILILNSFPVISVENVMKRSFYTLLQADCLIVIDS